MIKMLFNAMDNFFEQIGDFVIKTINGIKQAFEFARKTTGKPDGKIALGFSEAYPFSASEIYEVYEKSRSWDEVQCLLDYCGHRGYSDLHIALIMYEKDKDFCRAWWNRKYNPA